MTLRVSRLADGRKAITEPGEVWVQFPYHTSFYISSFGKVWGPKGLRKPSPNKAGHLSFVVYKDGKQKCFLVHRVVCELFHGQAPSDKPWALHKDHNPANCREDNLYWGNARDNADDMIAAGRSSHGERNSQAKLTWEKVRAARAKYATGKFTVIELALEYGTTGPNMSDVLRNKTWKEAA